VQRLNPNLPEANANLGMLALKKGDLKTAEQYIANATGANGLSEIIGNLHLAQGLYAQAEQDFSDIYSNSAALAQILNKNYASAAVTLKYVKNPDATTEYLKAVLNARMGNNIEAAHALRNAIAKDPSYKRYADNDLELSKVSK
jgi:Flp pilus assembly protein TadD